MAALGIGKSAFRADQDGGAVNAAGLGKTRYGIGRRITSTGLVAEDYGPVIAAGLKRLVKQRKGHDLSNIQPFGLFGGLDGVGQHAVIIDPRYPTVIGAHRPDAAASHFRGLLRDEIKPRLLHRREDKPQVGACLLLPGHLLWGQRASAPALAGQNSLPFAVTPVEQTYGIAIAKPHHIDKVMLLLLGRMDGAAFRQIIIDIQPCLGDRCVHLSHVSRSHLLCKRAAMSRQVAVPPCQTGV